MRAAVYRDWSASGGLPEDLILIVMQSLSIPDLLRAGAVCTTWRAACANARRVQFPITDSSPCLLYTCAADADDIATIYSVSTGAAFKVRLPSPAFRSRHVVGSGHGWVVTADEESNFQALNPLTGAQVDLPPVKGLDDVVERFSADQARLLTPWELRRYIYLAYLSCRPTAGSACAILLAHQCTGHLYFAHVGDARWTRITKSASLPPDLGFHSAVYNQNDGLFYVLSFSSTVSALDLSESSPRTVRTIFTRWDEVVRSWLGYNHAPRGDIILTPWGDILQVQRRYRVTTTPIFDNPESFMDDNILLFKVDTDERRLVRISGEDLRGHAFFSWFQCLYVPFDEGFPGGETKTAPTLLMALGDKAFPPSLVPGRSECGTLKPTHLRALARCTLTIRGLIGHLQFG